MPRRRVTVSVRVRILASMLAVTAAGMAIAGGTAFVVQRERVLSHIDTRLEDTAERLRTIATDTDFPTVRDLLGAAIQQITPDTNEGILGIIDGVAAVVPGSQVGLSLEDDPNLVPRINDETAAGEVVLGTAESPLGNLRYIAVPVTASADPSTGVYVAAYSLDAELAPIGDAFTTFAYVAFAALLGIALVGWFVAGRLLKPIRSLRDTAARITGSDLNERIPVAGRDDVSELTATVNDMLDRLQRAILVQRRLLDDVGHELKTPITIVRGHLELMDAADPDEIASTQELVIDELDRMNRLVADISLLASMHHTAPAERVPTDVRTLSEAVFQKVSALPDRDWTLVETADAVADLDADRVTQAWLQLASNATRHGTPGTPIELGSRVAADADGGERLQLWVRDHGPGIAPEAHERIFERFRREDEGRGETGSGLGLAIVASIARAHDGSVLLDSIPGIGSTFTLDLPLAAKETTAQ